MIESVDKIVPTMAINLPPVCEIMGACGAIFAVEVFPHGLRGDIFEVEIKDIRTGISIYSPPEKEWQLLVPDEGPDSYMDMYLEVWTKGLL